MRNFTSIFSQLLTLFSRADFQRLVRDHRAPSRSTLSYANAHRPWQLFEAVFGLLLARCQAMRAPKPFRFKNKLYSLDASVIDLCL